MNVSSRSPHGGDSMRRGAIYALLSYGAWGIFPIYWKGFGSAPPVEVIAHRLVWSFMFLGILVAARGEIRECLRILRTPRLAGILCGTALLLSINWGLFVLGVNTGRIVETSLGYFINPLFTVLLGCVVLRERLSRAQSVAAVLAGIGVAVFGWHLGHLPWIALGLSLTFGLYGLIRKMVPIQPLPGLFMETALITPVAAAVGAFFFASGTGHFPGSPGKMLLFVSAGIVTAAPLLWFNAAAKLLPLTVIGFLQYLAPTLQLLVGLLVYGEPFTSRRMVAFGFIWAAIAIFVADAARRRGRAAAVSGESSPQGR
jgi:rarD protein